MCIPLQVTDLYEHPFTSYCSYKSVTWKEYSYNSVLLTYTNIRLQVTDLLLGVSLYLLQTLMYE